MKPTAREYAAAVSKLSILRFFPPNPEARTEIMRVLDRMVPTVEQLDWLVQTMINRVGEWTGPVALRGIFCTRYAPADGIDADCSIPGFTANDGEARLIAASEEFKALPARPQIEAPSEEEKQFATELDALYKSKEMPPAGVYHRDVRAEIRLLRAIGDHEQADRLERELGVK